MNTYHSLGIGQLKGIELLKPTNQNVIQNSSNFWMKCLYLSQALFSVFKYICRFLFWSPRYLRIYLNSVKIDKIGCVHKSTFLSALIKRLLLASHSIPKHSRPGPLDPCSQRHYYPSTILSVIWLITSSLPRGTLQNHPSETILALRPEPRVKLV